MKQLLLLVAGPRRRRTSEAGIAIWMWCSVAGRREEASHGSRSIPQNRWGRAVAAALALSVLRFVATGLTAGEISLPPRRADAPGGHAFVRGLQGLDLAGREQAVVNQVLAGNVPEFWRCFINVSLSRTVGGRERTVELRVAPDYILVGSDVDHVPFPLSPDSAQRIADRLDCLLPTRRMVEAIHGAAHVKLAPSPIPPSARMTTVEVFLEHAERVAAQRGEWLPSHPLGELVSGHKKDVVITPRLVGAPGKVAIFGWFQTNGAPIQPLYLGHAATWVDYSHGIRLVSRKVAWDGMEARAEVMLADPEGCVLLSDEGPVVETRYLLPNVDAGKQPTGPVQPSRGSVTNQSGERVATLAFEPGVRVVVVEPPSMDAAKPLRLVLYALPNGNTIEQTLGRKMRTGDDWHFDIQHVAAQTRWLRDRVTNVNWVVALLECEGKSWPAWRRTNDPEDSRIPAIVDALRKRHPGEGTTVVLTGHSGGGSFTFGYMNALERIPDWVERIAFLDSNYAYDAAKGHAAKLASWLRASDEHALCVLAYHDSIALLNGKTFVSENGGTWGRSHAMQRDLAAIFPFEERHGDGFERYRALRGRVAFLLKENPEKAVLHTRLVEWNGFIHAMLLGTDAEEKGYHFFAPRVYGDRIAGE